MFWWLLVILPISAVLYIKWRQNYWQRKGIACEQTYFLLGDQKKRIIDKVAVGDYVLQKYQTLKRLDSFHGGAYFFHYPVYFPMDPDHIKQMLTKDFQYFGSHGLYHHPKDVLSMHLFNMEGESWKHLRAKLTPTFTSGKMKMMFDTLVAKTADLEKCVQKYVDSNDTINIKDVLGRFTTDIIGSCAFGIECNSIEDPENKFRKYGKEAFVLGMHKLLLLALFPWDLIANMGFKISGNEITQFFSNVVKQTIKLRETKNIFRKDFMHLLLQLKNQGFVSDSTEVRKGSKEKQQVQLLTEEEIIAQCFVFFLAGFETSSTTMTFALLALAQNPHIQEKLRKEINDVVEKTKGELRYDEIMTMPYLDKVVNETLRKYPPLPMVPRQCTQTYKVPGTDLVIEKGTRVEIPVLGLHMDPEYYPNPEVFDPERFSEENKASRKDFTFLPFGEGPRMCIGLRFGLMQTKVGLVSLLRKFKFSINNKTKQPIEFDKGFVLAVKGDVWLNVSNV